MNPEMIPALDKALPSAGAGATMPPRSALVWLDPIGLGTAYREGLSSYLMRLADAHCVRPHAIIRNLMKPHLNEYCSGLAETKKLEAWLNYPRFDSAAMAVSAFIGAMEVLTLRTGLASLTLVPFRGCLPTQDLVAKTRKWCPLCFRQDKVSGIPHLRLLWSMAEVKACPIHKIRLTNDCGCGPEDRLLPGEAKPSPGICGKCGRDLGRKSVPTAAASQDEILRALLIVNLLAAEGTVPLGNRDGLRTFLTESVKVHFDGAAAGLARCLGVSAGTFHDWLSGNHAPTFRNLMSIAQAHGCSIVDVLAGQIESIRHRPPMGVNNPVAKPRGASRNLDWPDVQCALEEILIRPEPISMKQAEEELGIDVRLLRARFGPLTKAISIRFLDQKTTRARSVIEERMARILDAASVLASEGIRPTQKQVLQRAGLPKRTFRNEQGLVKVLCAQVAPATLP